MLSYKEYATPDEYIDNLKATLHPLDWALLNVEVDGQNAVELLKETAPWHLSFVRRLFMFIALGGIACQAVKDAWDAGTLGVFGLDEPWAKGLLGIEQLDVETGVLLVKDPGCLDDPDVELFGRAGGKVLTMSEMFTEHLLEVKPTPKEFGIFLANLGGKLEAGTYRGITASVPWNISKRDGAWVMGWNDQPGVSLRPYFAINGKACVHAETIAILALGFILGAQIERAIRGRLAFSEYLWVEKVFVGWDSPRYGEFRRNKVALIGCGLRFDIAGCGVNLVEFPATMLEAAAAYDAAGYPVFMHKGGKYITVDARMIGMAKLPDGSISIGFEADKIAKTTARQALYCVPSAFEYTDDGKGASSATPKPKGLRFRKDS